MSRAKSAELARVYVFVGKEPRVVTCRLGGKRESAGIQKWSRQTKNRDNDTVDALEFAEHTTKRWSYYTSRKRAVSSLDTARFRVQRDRQSELAFLIALAADWAPNRILDFTLFRRTWCNHLVVDFLAAHPANRGDKALEITGILRAIFCAITEVAVALNTPRIWGEATDSSAEKYRHIFKLPSVDDLFILERRIWQEFRKQSRSLRT